MVDKLKFAEGYLKSDPAAAARVLDGEDIENSSLLVDAVNDKLSIAVLIEMVPLNAARILSRLPDDAAARYVGMMKPAQASAICQHLTDQRRAEILSRLPTHLATRLNIVLSYPKLSVGAWTDIGADSIHIDATVRDTVAQLVNGEYSYDKVFVTDDEGQLRGFVPVWSLMAGTGTVSERTRPVEYSIRGRASVLDIVGHPGWASHNYLPVVNRQNRYLGILSNSRIRSILSRSAIGARTSGVSGSYLTLAETCYLGMADVLSSAISSPKPNALR